MNRSPLFYALGRGMDADAGGTADLQTDVMRFMAIISIMAISWGLISEGPPRA